MYVLLYVCREDLSMNRGMRQACIRLVFITPPAHRIDRRSYDVTNSVWSPT